MDQQQHFQQGNGSPRGYASQQQGSYNAQQGHFYPGQQGYPPAAGGNGGGYQQHYQPPQGQYYNQGYPPEEYDEDAFNQHEIDRELGEESFDEEDLQQVGIFVF